MVTKDGSQQRSNQYDAGNLTTVIFFILDVCCLFFLNTSSHVPRLHSYNMCPKLNNYSFFFFLFFFAISPPE